MLYASLGLAKKCVFRAFNSRYYFAAGRPPNELKKHPGSLLVPRKPYKWIYKSPSQRPEHLTRLGRRLAWILRHGALRAGLYMRPDGFVRVDDMLKLALFRDVPIEDIREVVDYNPTCAFDTMVKNGFLMIRARANHNIGVITSGWVEVAPGFIPTMLYMCSVEDSKIVVQEGLSINSDDGYIHLHETLPEYIGMKFSDDATVVLVTIDATLLQTDHEAELFTTCWKTPFKEIITKGNVYNVIPPSYISKIEAISWKNETIL